ncbi:hypothetical protein [Xanthomonas phage BUDD]|nr:hypothetical protein [Xanthomonas phage BUDD]
MEHNAWLYTKDRCELEDFAIGMGIDPKQYILDESLIDAIIQKLEETK